MEEQLSDGAVLVADNVGWNIPGEEYMARVRTFDSSTPPLLESAPPLLTDQARSFCRDGVVRRGPAVGQARRDGGHDLPQIRGFVTRPDDVERSLCIECASK